jgi:hypothetical protein
MKYFSIIYPFLITFLLISCYNEKKFPIEPTEESYIIPLNAGNKWYGKAERISPSGEVITEWDFVREIIGWTIVDSVKLFILKHENGTEFNCVNTDSGFVFKHYNGDYLQYKYPARIGDKFDIAGNAYREVISVDTTIVTQYGEFKCHHYTLKIYGSNFHTEEFLSPDYGFIYQEHYQTDGSPQITLYSRTTYRPELLSNN